MSNVIVFDLDGVITSEEAYWDSAGLLLHELLYSPRYWDVGAAERGDQPYHPLTTAADSRRVSRQILPEAVIMRLKALQVNSNWDTSYVGFCLYLIGLLSYVPDTSALWPLRPWDEAWLAAFRQQLREIPLSQVGPHMLQSLEDPFFQDYVGFALINRMDDFASKVLGRSSEGVLQRRGPAWTFCRDLFQEWYLGDELFTQQYGHPPAQPGKPGCINFEQPLLPVERMRSALTAMQEQGYTLGVATGRPGQEAIVPLQNYGLLNYFAPDHIATDVEVMRAEAALRNKGDKTALGKPHPFPFLLAAQPNYQPGDPLPLAGSFVVVGDTPSDIYGARAGGAITIAVLTGARTPEARALLQTSQPDFTIEDMTQVPTLLEHIDDLLTIQRMQFSEKEKAERLLQRWFALHMNLFTESVTLTPRPVSLNSFNGIYRAGGEEYFFKTHVEEQEVLQEYYHAELLHKAGYNIVRPLRTLHEQGQQMVIYPVVHWPVLFDMARSIETGHDSLSAIELLTAAEKRECERILSIYRSTLAASSAEEHAQAPVHQLFWHRLTAGRLKSFYEGKSLQAQSNADGEIPFTKILAYRWTINGIEQNYTLGELIARATEVLNPQRAAMTVIGHGDAHFGNVFLQFQRDYLYFDPAFAGRHSPLLDVIKPLFHNIFATWMYFPFEYAKTCALETLIDEQRQAIIARYDFALPPVREAILSTKLRYLIQPLLEELHTQHALPEDWLALMQSALLCCPLLTVNLFDSKRMPATISWLGFLYAVYMGNNGLTAWEVGRNL